MRRTQIQIDEQMHEALRRRAYEEGTSIASIIRDSLSQSLRPGAGKPRTPRKLREFPFVGAGRSASKELAPVSERHDEALAAALRKKAGR